jgi:predicted PurR-regulated permease PerM
MTRDPASPGDDPFPPRRGTLVNPLVERLAAYSWRLLVIAGGLAGVAWLVGRLWIVFLPLLIATLLGRILQPPVAWLRVRGWRPALAAAVVLVGFLAAMASITTAIGVAVRGQVHEVVPTLSTAVDDIERWLVEDAPVKLDRSDLDRFRRNAGDALGEVVRSPGGAIVSGVVVAVEVAASLFVGLIITFFVLKDGDRFLQWIHRQLPERRRALAAALAARAWATLGGYLRGAALLGVVEGTVIGVTLAAVGAKLAVPLAVVTFFAAFVPFIGAIVAAALAVLVALATGSTAAGLIVLAVAVLVQQLDNDILSPLVYGRALQIHPVVVLLAVGAGGALFGIAGSLLAVPVTAVAINVGMEARTRVRDDPPPS